MSGIVTMATDGSPAPAPRKLPVLPPFLKHPSPRSNPKVYPDRKIFCPPSGVTTIQSHNTMDMDLSRDDSITPVGIDQEFDGRSLDPGSPAPAPGKLPVLPPVLKHQSSRSNPKVSPDRKIVSPSSGVTNIQSDNTMDMDLSRDDSITPVGIDQEFDGRSLDPETERVYEIDTSTPELDEHAYE